MGILSLSIVLGVSTAMAGSDDPTSGPLTFGVATGAPGEVVEVPVTARFDRPLRYYVITFRFDADRLRFLDFDIDGTAAEAFGPFARDSLVFPPDEGYIRLDSTGRDAKSMVTIPPGTRVLIAKMRFQVLASAPAGDASVTPVEGLQSTGAMTGLYLHTGSGTLTFLPKPLVAGKVQVTPPQGPRPVLDLGCEQLLDRAILTFSPTEPYDAIQVSRGGTVLATLPGDATTFTETPISPGALEYSVVALQGGEESIPASCQLIAVTPAAPLPRDFTCGDAGLSWRSPVPYDRISISRNGAEAAVLPGDATSWVDPERPDVMTVYGVVGELQGFWSPEAHCIDRGEWIIEVGDVEVPLDSTRVVLPIYLTSSEQVSGFGLCLDVDATRLRPVDDFDRALEGTEGPPDPDFVAMGLTGSCGLPAGAMIYAYNSHPRDMKVLLPGIRQRIINFVLDPSGPISEGDTLPATLDPESIVFTVYRSGTPVSQWPDRIIPGVIRFGAGNGPLPVQKLRSVISADSGNGEGGMVGLAWENGGAYDAIHIERNGVELAEIPGDQQAFTDRSAVRGIYTYKVTADAGGRQSFPAGITFSTFTPRGGFLRGDANMDGRIDLTDVIATLSFLYQGGTPLACDDAADADDSGALDINDAMAVIRYLFLSGAAPKAPGVVRPWFDPTPDALSCGK